MRTRRQECDAAGRSIRRLLILIGELRMIMSAPKDRRWAFHEARAFHVFTQQTIIRLFAVMAAQYYYTPRRYAKQRMRADLASRQLACRAHRFLQARLRFLHRRRSRPREAFPRADWRVHSFIGFHDISRMREYSSQIRSDANLLHTTIRRFLPARPADFCLLATAP